MNFMDGTMDKDNILLFGLTAAALGLSLFILWGPKLGRRNGSNCSLVGLQNLGLTCFLNSLLQSLASCPSFIHWLQSGQNNGAVSESLYTVLKLLCYERDAEFVDEVYSPDGLISTLRGKVWPVFPQEQDPHELFLQLLSTLEDEEQRSAPERVESLLDALEGAEPKTVNSQGDVPTSRNTLPVKVKRMSAVSPFRGYLASQLSCLKCHHKSTVVYDKFYSLSFALPPKAGTFTLKRLLDDFVSTELVDGFSCDECNKARDPSSPPLFTQASKAIKIGKLPKCLCLHISRTYMDTTGCMYKRDNYVDFPEFLKMDFYTHNSSMLREKQKLKLLKPVNTGIKFSKGSSGLVVGGESDPTLTKFTNLGPTTESDKPPVPPLSSDEEFETPPSSSSHTPSLLKNNNYEFTSNGNPCFTENKDGYYRLKAVIEHRGTVESGHFVAYRRGPLQSNTRHRSREFLNQSESRWFFTSDETVRKSSLCDALYANAYLLFYERCSSDFQPAS